MSRRGPAAAGLLAVVALAVLVGVGRWERSHNATIQNAGMRATYELATSNGLFSPRLYLYRLDQHFDCLDYGPPGHPEEFAAYELCFDPSGRLTETIDRASGVARIHTLRSQPSLATLRVPVARLTTGMRALGMYSDPRLGKTPFVRSQLPLIDGDFGAFFFPARVKKSK